MIDIIPKAKRQESLIFRAALWVALTIFIVVLGGYLMLWFLESRTTDRLIEVETLLGEGRTQEQVLLESRVFSSKARLQDFATLVSNRKNYIPAFTFLETTVHPNVYFPGVTVHSLRQAMDLRGHADSFAVLDEQMAIFQARTEPNSVSLTSLRLSETGGVDFQLTLQFPLSFFQQ